MGNPEIVAIPNQYKDTLDDFIDSSDLWSPDWARLIDKRSHNALISESSSTDLSKGDCLNKDLLNRSSQFAPKTKYS